MKQDYFFGNNPLKNKTIYAIAMLLIALSSFVFFGFYVKDTEEKSTESSVVNVVNIKEKVKNMTDEKIDKIEKRVNSKISDAENIISGWIDKLNNEQKIKEEEVQQIAKETAKVQTLEEVKPKAVQEAKREEIQEELQERIEIKQIEQVETIEILEPQQSIEVNIYTTPSGESYSIIGTLSIPNLGIKNSILSETSTELLNISLNKLWGPNPNEVGNMVIVGHNYRDNSTRCFSRLHNIQIGDIVKIEDITGKVLNYTVYDTFVVDPHDVSCTNQLTDGGIEITLITCYNQGTQRFVVKARAN